MQHRRTGFTLIELLIVIVIIGILASIALPRFAKTRERAYFKSMMSDLRNLSVQQEVYYSGPNNTFTYTNDLTALAAVPSVGVTLNPAGATNQGWQATAIHAGLATTQTCGIYYGTPSTYPAAYIDVAGVVKCTND
jgi:prepilin-type N-terminal cleavage/methylation domain-containing protein